jgi:ABC-2 type transport system permease protein
MKIYHIMKRIIKQTVNDKRSLGLILIVPIFLFTLIYFLLGDSDYKATIAEYGMQPQIIKNIKAEGVSVESMDLNKGKHAVKEKETDALLYMDDGEIVILFESNDTVKTGVITKAVQSAVKKLNSQGGIRVEHIYNERKDNMFDSIGYILLGIISFFLIFIIAGISFVRERTVQTLERLMMTPVKRWQIVLGYTIGFGIFAMLQSILLLAYVKWVLQMTIAGSVIDAGFIMILLSMSAVCIGAFCSIYANNEFQMMQFIPVIVIPQIFFSGIISLDTLPYHLGGLSKIMPAYYACDALSSIIIKGKNLGDVIIQIIALLTFILLFFMLNIIALKKYRRI